VIEIDGVEKEYFITYESDYNGSKLEIYHDRKEIKDEEIHDFIHNNYDEIGFEEEVGDDDWVELWSMGKLWAFTFSLVNIKKLKINK